MSKSKNRKKHKAKVLKRRRVKLVEKAKKQAQFQKVMESLKKRIENERRNEEE